MGTIKNFLLRHRLQRHRTKGRPASTSPPPATEPIHQHRTHLDELHLVFSKFDSNGDGKISSTELSSIFESLGNRPTPEELRSIMGEADSDGDGFISLAEFVDLNTRGIGPEDALEDIKQAFSFFDLDDNGSISADELMKVLGSLGEGATKAECRKMISGVDKDGDGCVDFEEFKDMMMSSGSLSSSCSSRSFFGTSLNKIEE